MSSGSKDNYPDNPAAGQKECVRTPQHNPYPPRQNATDFQSHSHQAQQYDFAPPPVLSSQQPGPTDLGPSIPTHAAIQATARSFYKVGKGFLGDLASNIKTKYPPAASIPPQQQIHNAGQQYQQQPWGLPIQHGTHPVQQTLTHGSHKCPNMFSLAAEQNTTSFQAPYTSPPECYQSPPAQSSQIGQSSHHTPPTTQQSRYTEISSSISSPNPQEYQQSLQQPSRFQASSGVVCPRLSGQVSQNTTPVTDVDIQAYVSPHIPPAASSSPTLSAQSAHKTAINKDNNVHPDSPPPVPPPHTRPDMITPGSQGRVPSASTIDSTGQNFQVQEASVSQHLIHPPHSAENGSDPEHDLLGSLSTQMSDLNVRGNIPTIATANYHSHLAENDRPRAPPPYQATGTDWDVLAECTEARTVTYSLDWYRFLDVPDYVVCTRCYTDYIAGTSLAGHFERITRPDGSASRCVFWAPRVREVLWQRAVQSNDIGPLATFLKKSMDVPACKGPIYTTGADGVKYFSMTDNEIDGFIVCEECYDDRVVGTPFESRFSPYLEQQGEDEKWACDLAIPYIRTAALEESKRDRWPDFVEGCTTRMSLPACEGIETQSNHCNWYQPRRKIEGMHVCEACYMDKLALTRFADEFLRLDGSMDASGETWTCALSDKAINLSAALGAALYQRNFDVFWEAADAISKLVPCTSHGIVRGKWWTVAGGCPDLDVCEACYHGILLSSGLGHFFEPAERDPTLEIVCNFCPETHRFAQFVDKFAEALDKGVFSYYANYVRTWAGVPSCPGIRSREGGCWWGYPDATFCQECYMSFVAHTSLADAVLIRAVHDERAMICQMWSPRMRKLWLATCEAGTGTPGPGSEASERALAEFRAFAQRRLKVYDATVPQIEMIEGMRLIRMQQAMHQGQLSVLYSGMNSMASVAGTTDGYWHGNSSLGWYETEHGVTAATMRNNMASGMAGANRMDDWMQIAQLQTLWLEVE